MGVFTNGSVIAAGDDGDLPSLVEDVRAGRPAATERLAARVRDRVRAWALRITGDDDAADDVAQDVLISLERRVHKFSGASKFSTWLFAVTRNVALTQRRREERRAEILEREAGHALDMVQTTDPDPDTVRLGELVLVYFDRLSGRQRQIFELADIRGMTPAEIARELGMQQVTVRAHLFKARRAIRERMLEHHERLLKEYTS
jgi:RNA polymerase sigma-70 factor (ECF subfamily)